MTSNPSSNDKLYKIELVTKVNTDEIIEFLRKHYYIDNPLYKNVANEPCDHIIKWIKLLIKLGYSFKAVNLNNGKIIGVILNRIMSPIEFEPKAEKCKNPNLKIVLTFLEYIKVKKLPEIYVDKKDFRTMDIEVLSVFTEYRRLGIATELLNKTIEYCKAIQIQRLHCLSSSAYGGMVCQKLGFQSKFSYNYEKYIVDGKNPLLPEKPHVEITLYVKQI